MFVFHNILLFVLVMNPRFNLLLTEIKQPPFDLINELRLSLSLNHILSDPFSYHFAEVDTFLHFAFIGHEFKSQV